MHERDELDFLFGVVGRHALEEYLDGGQRTEENVVRVVVVVAVVSVQKERDEFVHEPDELISTNGGIVDFATTAAAISLAHACTCCRVGVGRVAAATAIRVAQCSRWRSLDRDLHTKK